MKNNTCFIHAQDHSYLSWPMIDSDSRIKQIKKLLGNQIEHLIKEYHVQHFIIGLDRGVETLAAELILDLKERHPITLECVLAYEEEAANWSEYERNRYFRIIQSADYETLLQTKYTLDCREKRNEYMFKHSNWGIMVFFEQRISMPERNKSNVTVIDIFIE